MDDDTALAEYKQTSTLLPPGTICAYLAMLPPLVDLRRIREGGWDPIWEDWSVDWRHQAFDLHIDPTSWDLAELAIDAASPGIIFPSTVHQGGTNLVIYPDALAATPDASIAVPTRATCCRAMTPAGNRPAPDRGNDNGRPIRG